MKRIIGILAAMALVILVSCDLPIMKKLDNPNDPLSSSYATPIPEPSSNPSVSPSPSSSSEVSPSPEIIPSPTPSPTPTPITTPTPTTMPTPITIPRNGLIAEWLFSGNTLDMSGYGHDGTNNGAILTTDRFGNINSAYTFDGSDDYIDVGHTGDIPEGTIAAWVTFNAIDSTPVDYFDNREVILTWGNSYGSNGDVGGKLGLNWDSSHTLAMTLWDDTGSWRSANGNILPSLGEWHLVLGTWGPTGMKTYLDGSLIGTDPYTGGLETYGTTLIGSNSWTGWAWQRHNGKIDDVRIYNRVLNSSEIISLYNEPSGYVVPGTTWTARTLPANQNWTSVAYGNGTFVAVALGPTATAATSSDGITWNTRTLPLADHWVSITYANGLFVLTPSGINPYTLTSPDGITWTTRTFPALSPGWDSIAYGNGTYVAISYNSGSTAAYSTNLDTWTTLTLPGSDNLWHSIAYGNGIFVAVANFSSTAVTSSDGALWTTRSLPASTEWDSIVFGNGIFVAIACNGTTAATSADGINWTLRALPVSASWSSIAFGNDTFTVVATNNSSAAATSPDGIHWTLRSLPSSAEWDSVTFGYGKFVVISTGAPLEAGTKAATSP